MDGLGGEPPYSPWTECYARVEASIHYAFHYVGGHGFTKMQLHARLGHDEASRDHRHAAIGRVHHKSDRQFADFASIRELRVSASLIECGKHCPAVRQESFSCACEACLSRMTIEQSDPEPLLQCSDLPAERRLCYIEPLGRTTKMQGFRDGYEISELANIDHDTESECILSPKGIGLHRIHCLGQPLQQAGIPMLSVLMVVLPIFALIFAGWATRRMEVLGPHASSELNRFVVYLALPALLFDIVASAQWHEIWQPAFIATFSMGMAAVFATTLIVRLHRSRHLADAAIDGLNAAYANTGFLGFPLALAVLGPMALTPTLVATILTVCVLFAVALILIEVGLQTERHPRRMIGKVLASLVRNPLLVAPTAGVLFLAFGVKVPAAAESFLKLLGAAASPCALVALGLFLAEKRETGQPTPGATGLLVTLKLVGQPLATWAFAIHVFHLPPPLARAAILLAALPTGTGPFMVAEFYRREASLTSRAVLISTIASLATITLYLSLWK